MGQASTIQPITERFVSEYNRLKAAGKLPTNTELANIMGIKTPSTISNILKLKQNIQPEAWDLFRKEFKISEGNGQANTNGLPKDTKEIYERWLADKEKTQQQFHATNQGLIELLKSKLEEIAANLTTGQKQLGEQLFVVGDGLRQQLEGIASGLAAKDRSAEKDKGVSGQKGNIHGKSKDH